MENTDKYIGQFLDNRYEILEKIGTGGMAVVYKARCHRLNRLVAVKILKDELAEDADFRRRFHTESQAVAMLSHPNIVAVYDVSRSGNTEYIVMELIEGITLKQYINRKGLLNWKESLHFATQITKALSHAHSRGIIHRDIKPHNIMILKDGSVKVADFGIARLLSTQNTLTQETLGSVHYISPEQAKGSHIDARSDLYSVGVVLYEMLTSRLPFEGDSAVAVAIQHISAYPLLPREINPDIPIGLESITMHAMEPDMNSRYASADEMLEDLEEFRKNPSIIFSYSASEQTVGIISDEATRGIPSGAIIRAEASLPKIRRSVNKSLPSKEEYSHSKRKSSKTTTLVGIFAIIVFLLIVFVFMWNFVLKDIIYPADTTLTIPTFVGQYYSDVSENTEYTQYYVFKVTQENNDTYPEGMIIAQDPKPDRQHEFNTEPIEITLIVSLGSEPVVTMPDLQNIDWREAKIELDELGLNLEYVFDSVNDNDITKSYVISTIPEAGDPLIEGGTVYITYSDGPEVIMVFVPNLIGLTFSQAKLALEARDLVYNESPEYAYSDTVPSGQVMYQATDAGTEVAIHTKIIFQVSMGPEPTPTPSPTPTPTPTPSPTPTVTP